MWHTVLLLKLALSGYLTSNGSGPGQNHRLLNQSKKNELVISQHDAVFATKRSGFGWLAWAS